VTQWWDYPPLVKAMAGHITNQGAWEGDVPWYADELTRARLQILERQEKFNEYVRLAEAEGQPALSARMLARTGQIDKAVTMTKEQVAEPSEVWDVVTMLAETGEQEQALSLAQYGLTLDSQAGKTELAQWLRQQAEAAGRAELALRFRSLVVSTAGGVSPITHAAREKIVSMHNW
jgi:hypothetical protein